VSKLIFHHSIAMKSNLKDIKADISSSEVSAFAKKIVDDGF